MEKYTQAVQTLSDMSNKVDGKMNRSMRRNMAPRLNKAGVDFLSTIHEECKGLIGATQDELEEEQELLREQNTAPVVIKPELTLEYLKSIGREDMASW